MIMVVHNPKSCNPAPRRTSPKAGEGRRRKAMKQGGPLSSARLDDTNSTSRTICSKLILLQFRNKSGTTSTYCVSACMPLLRMRKPNGERQASATPYRGNKIKPNSLSLPRSEGSSLVEGQESMANSQELATGSLVAPHSYCTMAFGRLSGWAQHQLHEVCLLQIPYPCIQYMYLCMVSHVRS